MNRFEVTNYFGQDVPAQRIDEREVNGATFGTFFGSEFNFGGVEFLKYSFGVNEQFLPLVSQSYAFVVALKQFYLQLYLLKAN